MKRAAQPALSVESLLVFDQYMHLLQRMEDLSIITIRNYYRDPSCSLRELIPTWEAFLKGARRWTSKPIS